LKILFIHNNYAQPSGEEHAAEGLAKLLELNGHQVKWYRRTTEGVQWTVANKINAFVSGFHNMSSVRQVKHLLNEFNPDIVQVQNLYPFISPSILKVIKSHNTPVVMRCPNYRLFCPNGLFLDRKGNVCEKCTGKLKESWCVWKNCEGNIGKSMGYGLRNMWARLSGSIFNYVDAYIVQSSFQKEKFFELGIPSNRLHVVPGLTPSVITKSPEIIGEHVAFVGRVSIEKGIVEFTEAARLLPDIPFVVAGRISPSVTQLVKHSPANIEWKGFLSGAELDQVFRNSRIIVAPSKWYEGFPNVITRAMLHRKPVITSNLGAMASIINHNKNGYLIEPGSITQLAKSISSLFNDPDKCIQFGLNGQKKAEAEYSAQAIYERLMNIYTQLINQIV